MRVKKDSRNFSYIFKVQFTKLWNFYMQGKSHSEEVCLVWWLYKTLWMKEKLKNYQAFNLSLLSLWVCVYVCVCVCRAGPVCVKWNGGGCLFSVTVRRVWGGRGRGRDRQTWLAEIVFTLWPESDGNRTALPNRVLQIHRYTESVLRQNTADPSHIYKLFQTRRN